MEVHADVIFFLLVKHGIPCFTSKKQQKQEQIDTACATTLNKPSPVVFCSGEQT